MFHYLRVLLIAADPDAVKLAESVLGSEGHSVTSIAEPIQALIQLQEGTPYDAVLFDSTRQRMVDLSLLSDIAKSCGRARVWLVASLGINPWRDQARSLGISTIVCKPLQRHDLERMTQDDVQAPWGAAEIRRSVLNEGSAKPACYMEELPGDRYFLAGCDAMRQIYDTVRLLAPVDVPVLILGESGVGKDIVASLLHKHSLRARESYTSVNCAALPSDLLESELFGYEAGAFTGALKAKPGKFELADKGTILLDEIGEMSAPMQAKLLHVLQDGRYSRLGSRTATKVDVRVVAATNVDVEKAISEGTFREDLYYRISALTLEIPPLRSRREEIPFLVTEMARRQASHLRLEPIQVSAEMLQAMADYDWPGNLRELSNFVSRLLILRSQEPILNDLRHKVKLRRGLANARVPSRDVEASAEPETMRSVVRDLKDRTESRLIQDALDAAGWNRRRAAVHLQISYRGLLYKIQQYNLKEHLDPVASRTRLM